MKRKNNSLLTTEVEKANINESTSSKKVWEIPKLTSFSITQTLSGNVPAASESAYDSTHSNS